MSYSSVDCMAVNVWYVCSQASGQVHSRQEAKICSTLCLQAFRVGQSQPQRFGNPQVYHNSTPLLPIMDDIF